MDASADAVRWFQYESWAAEVQSWGETKRPVCAYSTAAEGCSAHQAPSPCQREGLLGPPG